MAQLLATGKTLFGYETQAQFHEWLLSKKSVREQMRVLRVEPSALTLEVDAGAAPAVAYHNHGRWVADCPEPLCGGAVAAQDGVPFLCPRCLNGGIRHRYRLVLWPDGETRDAVERVLSQRFVLETRNWYPGEPTDHLRAENVERGLPDGVM